MSLPRILSQVTLYRLRHGVYPKAWYISLSDMKSISLDGRLTGLVLDHGDARTLLIARDLTLVFPKLYSKRRTS